jgi:hypothetical protein
VPGGPELIIVLVVLAIPVAIVLLLMALRFTNRRR